jgi:hypothetical protein
MAGGAIGAKLPAVLIIVGVAGITIPRRAFELSTRVAGSAVHPDVLPGQRKRRLGMVESHVFPTGRGMAQPAIGAKLPAVLIIVGVAAVTILRQADIFAPRMAARAIHTQVFSGELEGCLIVVEGGLIPGGRRMAGRTIFA